MNDVKPKVINDMDKNITKTEAMDNLLHYGVVGMKWGKRREYKKAISKTARESGKAAGHAMRGIGQSRTATMYSQLHMKRLSNFHQGLADKHFSKATSHNEKAAKFIKNASDLGFSKPTPIRDKFNPIPGARTRSGIAEALNYERVQKLRKKAKRGDQTAIKELEEQKLRDMKYHPGKYH